MATVFNMMTLYDTRPLKQEAWLKCKDSLVNLEKQVFHFISTKLKWRQEKDLTNAPSVTEDFSVHDNETEFSPSQEDFSNPITAQDVTKEITEVNVSFSGCAFLGPYLVGSLKCFQDHIGGRFKGEPSNFAVDQCLGASAGALMAACLILEYPALELFKRFNNVIEKANKHTFGPLNKNCHLNSLLRDELEIIFEEDAHLKVSGKLHISMTDLSGENHIVSQFESRQSE